MTRIIGGAHAGRRLSVPAGARPTTDRVREAVFSSLTHRLPGWRGLRVLDLFAGSGALGLEALSRGAARAVLVERDRAAAAVLRRNIEALHVTAQARVVVADALRWRPPPGAVFDLVLADPPYELEAGRVAQLLLGLGAAGALAPGAELVVERPARDHQSPLPPAWPAESARRYGETSVWYGRAQGTDADREGDQR